MRIFLPFNFFFLKLLSGLRDGSLFLKHIKGLNTKLQEYYALQEMP